MSIILANPQAKFLINILGKFRFQFSTELFGHSETQSQVLKAVLNAKSRIADVVIGTAMNGHQVIEVLIEADEAEVSAAVKAEQDRLAGRNDFAPNAQYPIPFEEESAT